MYPLSLLIFWLSEAYCLGDLRVIGSACKAATGILLCARPEAFHVEPGPCSCRRSKHASVEDSASV